MLVLTDALGYQKYLSSELGQLTPPAAMFWHEGWFSDDLQDIGDWFPRYVFMSLP